MINVAMRTCTEADPIALASYAALMCYQSEVPEWGKIINVKDRLFEASHHTTIEHYYMTFVINGIAVGDTIFGFHLVSPFYDSDQRSGRFCAKMFLVPDYRKIEEYVLSFWPEVNIAILREIMEYAKEGVNLYHENIGAATEIAKKFIREERPFASEDYIKLNAPKIAQEQMRMCISVIFPTALVFTLDSVALAAMYRSAWSPPLRFTLQKMADLLLEKHPNMAFAFGKEMMRQDDWGMSFSGEPSANTFAAFKPGVSRTEIDGKENLVIPRSDVCFPVDQLFFRPETMNNSVGGISSEIVISLATMGQDQRHRTINRSEPSFTGDFYCPPIFKEVVPEKRVVDLMKKWITLHLKVPKSLALILAPYGAMARYTKRGSFNAIIHEQLKRSCWCAQEEIYHLSRALRLAIEKKEGKSSPLLRIFEPPCLKTGKCAEGVRYCGRDIDLRHKGDYFPERRV